MFCKVIARSAQHTERLKRANRAALRRQWLCTRVHDLGPRVFFELINEIERHGVADLDRRLEAYANFDPELL
jgi:hypothetical protein